MKTLFSSLLGLLGAAVLAHAADPTPALDKPPLPKGRLLGRVADFSCWQVDYAYALDKAERPKGAPLGYPAPTDNMYLTAPPRKVTLTRTKPLWLAVTVDVNGKTLQDASDGSQEFLVTPDSSSATLYSTDGFGKRGSIDYHRVDFPDLEWVSPRTYVGVQSVSSGMCLVFKEKEMTAWIDLETRMPVLWQSKGETRTFRQLPSPTSPLVLPPEIAELSEGLKKDRAILRRPAPRGG